MCVYMCVCMQFGNYYGCMCVCKKNGYSCMDVDRCVKLIREMPDYSKKENVANMPVCVYENQLLFVFRFECFV